MGRRIGYARVGADDQDLTIQKTALDKDGCAIVFEEKRSGARRTGREQLELALKVLTKGDTLVVTRLERLGRSLDYRIRAFRGGQEKGLEGTRWKVLEITASRVRLQLIKGRYTYGGPGYVGNFSSSDWYLERYPGASKTEQILREFRPVTDGN